MAAPSRIHTLKRPAIERMMRIHAALKEDTLPNCASLARELEVSSKTISRDIDFMRDRMQLPIDYDASEHGYYYTRDVQSLPTIDISEGELLALSIARKSLDLYKGTPFEGPLERAFGKLSASLPETVTANLSELSDVISFKQGRLSNVDPETLNRFTEAALEKRSITFQYRKPASSQAETRHFEPYHLTNYTGKWYAIGYDLKRKAIRTFLLSRASGAQQQESSFSIPKTFNVEDFIWPSFGMFSPAGDQAVEIVFDAAIAGYIMENVWHPTQKIKAARNGSVTLSMQLKGLEEVAHWALSWGKHAQVTSPVELKDALKEIALDIARRYS